MDAPGRRGAVPISCGAVAVPCMLSDSHSLDLALPNVSTAEQLESGRCFVSSLPWEAELGAAAADSALR